MGHILITGPGRSGTTFLVQLLNRAGAKRYHFLGATPDPAGMRYGLYPIC
jgi:hypothetical protein